MKRVLPVLALTVAAVIPLWRYEPSLGTSVEAAPPIPAPPVTPPGRTRRGLTMPGGLSGRAMYQVPAQWAPRRLDSLEGAPVRATEVDAYHHLVVDAEHLLDIDPPSVQRPRRSGEVGDEVLRQRRRACVEVAALQGPTPRARTASCRRAGAGPVPT